MQDCIFCKISAKEIPCSLVYEDDDLLAFRDIQPVSPIHILIIPRKHYPSLNEISDISLLGRLVDRARLLASEFNISETGFRIVVNTGTDAGQSVNHLHLHLLGARTHHWPPG